MCDDMTRDETSLNINSYRCVDALTIAFACVDRDAYLTHDMKRNALSTLRAMIEQRDCARYDDAIHDDALTTLCDVIIFG
jgi:hypothetical protein